MLPFRTIVQFLVTMQTLRNKQGINLLAGHLVKSFDPARRKVFGATDQGKTFEFSYDKLLIATGGSPGIS